MTTAYILAITAACLAAAILLALFLYEQNERLRVTRHTLYYDSLPRGFDGFTVLQVSDLHNKRFGKGQARLIALTKSLAPNVIAATGDLADTEDHKNVTDYFAAAARLAPCYYISGNHEARGGWWPDLKRELDALGLTLLDDASATLSRGSESISLCGVADPKFRSLPAFPERLEAVKKPGFTILLSHRPERIADYASYGFDLVLTGHAHGGQFRLPLVGGLYAPDQGLFPKYTAGVYERDGTRMEVSRGLGRSRFPLRLFNRPELVLLTLKRK